MRFCGRGSPGRSTHRDLYRALLVALFMSSIDQVSRPREHAGRSRLALKSCRSRGDVGPLGDQRPTTVQIRRLSNTSIWPALSLKVRTSSGARCDHKALIGSIVREHELRRDVYTVRDVRVEADLADHTSLIEVDHALTSPKVGVTVMEAERDRHRREQFKRLGVLSA